MFHLVRDGKEIGQFSEEEIREQLAAAKLTPDDSAWGAGMTEWERIGELNFTQPPIPGQKKRMVSLAATSLICGLLSFPASVVAGVPAIITGHLAVWQIKNSKDLSGLDYAYAGLTLGYVTTAFLCFVILWNLVG